MSSTFRMSDLPIKMLVGLEVPTRHPHIKRIISINRIEILFTRILEAYATIPPPYEYFDLASGYVNLMLTSEENKQQQKFNRWKQKMQKKC